MGTSEPAKATVDANVFVQSFPRYLCLALHNNRISSIKSYIGDGVVLDTDEHSGKIKKLGLKAKKDRHVLYLAYFSESKYLVTNNLRHFRLEDIDQSANQELGFHSDVEVVSFDRFLCTLMLDEKKRKQGDCAVFLVAVKETMVYMRRYSVRTIFSRLKKQCPGAYNLLLPYFDEIKAAVEAGRQTLR